MKKWFYPAVYSLSAVLLIFTVLVLSLGTHYRVGLNPVKTLSAEEIESFSVTLVKQEGSFVPNWVAEVDSREEIARMVELYNQVEKSTFGIFPEYKISPNLDKVDGYHISLGIHMKDGGRIELWPCLTTQDDRFQNVFEVRGGGPTKAFFPSVKNIYGWNTSGHIFFCEETALKEFWEYSFDLAKTGKFWGNEDQIF